MTSKLVRFEDLQEVPTFGFRGEALASLAVCGIVTIQSTREGEDVGYKCAPNHALCHLVSMLWDCGMLCGLPVPLQCLCVPRASLGANGATASSYRAMAPLAPIRCRVPASAAPRSQSRASS